MNMKDRRTESTDRLFKAMLALGSVEEFYDFFEDLCTVKEIRDMSQRFEVAALLDRGLSYQKVSEMTNVSSATISRVKRCLDYGSGGYSNALDKLEEK
ncbi:MAG: helix-turn-helix domain-containing protein [Firmicutes bacterium]|nr:helix-turn-helix domain-containing protein [Bacillota bacterium]